MAMVFKSKKDLEKPIQKKDKIPGPGDYLPQTKFRKIHLNKEPFLSTINGTFHKRNNFPGPGAYYQDDILIHFLKNVQNQKITDSNEKRSLSQSKINEITNENNSREKFGFNSKTKRFNIIVDSNKPGPGYYFPKINKYYKNRIQKIKEEYNAKQRKLNRITKEINLVPTIPAKNQKYGFDVLEDGKLVQKKAPNLNQTYTGEKGDSVGPGSYEIEKKNEWYKTRPHWTMSKDVRNCYITNWENMSKIENPSLISTNHSEHTHSTNFNNSNLLSSITANKFFVDDNLNVFELSPYNISNYSISNYDSQTNFNNSNINFEKIIQSQKKLNNTKPIINHLYHNEKLKKKNSREIFKINKTPGPGFYIDRYKHSSFKIKPVPENRQYFGSKLERFFKLNKSFDNNDNYDRPSIDTKIYSNSFISSAPFSSKEQRFQTPNYLKEKFDNPSPFDYDNHKLKKIKSFSNFDKFNTSEKRFLIDNKMKWKEGIPGPGYYNPEKTKKHISTKKLRDSYDKNDNINKPNIYINPINYKINTIEYLNNKKLNSTNLKNVTFFRCNPKLTKSSSCKNMIPPPGTYYKEKKYEFKQIKPPFNSSLEKKVELNKEFDINVGSGQYNHDSYFDWHKKSFNISYV